MNAKSHISFLYKALTVTMTVALLFVALVSTASAASAQLDAWSNLYSGSPNNNAGTINTGNITVSAGANRLLVVAVCTEYSGSQTATFSASLAGTALTQVASTMGTSSQENCWMGYLLDNQIPAGSSTLSVTYDIGGTTTQMNGLHVSWASYAGIDQANPIYDSSANYNGGTTVQFGSTVNYLQNGLTLYAAANGGSNAGMNTIPGGFTQRLSTISSGHSSYVASITTAPHAANGSYAANTTVGFNGTTSNRSAVVVASLRPYFIPTTTNLISSLNPSLVGDNVTFTATVTSTSGTPTGTVTFRDGANTLGTGTLDASGIATFTTSTLTVGLHNITAVYSGDTNYGSSTSAVLAQIVNQPPTIVSADTTTFTVGTAGTFTVAVNGYPASTFSLAGDPLPAGVIFNTTTGVLSGTPTLGTNAVGTYNLVITASNGINPSATQNFTLNVIKRNQTITFNAPASAQYGTSFTINPTTSSGLPVTVVASGGCTLAGNTVTMTSSTVNCVLTASQAGNADYNAAANVVETVTALRANTSVTFTASSNPSVYGETVVFTVVVTSSGGTPQDGTVTLRDGGTVLGTGEVVDGVAIISVNNLAIHTFFGLIIPYNITVTYGGNTYFNGDSADISHTVNKASTQTVVTSDINPSAVGQTVTFTATVSVHAPGGGIPTGTVSFYDGVTLLNTTPANLTIVDGVATATFSTNGLAFGSHNITAVYNGDAHFATSTSAIYVQIVNHTTTIDITSGNNPSVYGQNVTFTATVASGTPGTINGTVNFYDGATLLGSGTVAGGVATFTTNALVVGTHPITATYVPAVGSIFATSTSTPPLNQVVDSATIVVTANNQAITYGDADPSPLTFTYTGFVLGQTAAVIDTAPTCDASATPHTNVGTYPGIIVCSGAADDNYTFTYVNGDIIVAQKTLIITANNQTKIYFTTFTFAGTEFSTNGLLPGDSVDSVTLTSTGALQTATVAGSPYPIVITPGSEVGTGLSNYAITYVDGSMAVVPSGTNVLTITANDQTKTYGDTFTFTGIEFSVTGLQGGDTLTSVTFTTSGTPPATNSAAVVGSYTITPSAAIGTGLSNYVIVYTPGQMVITERNLTFNPNNQTKTYGDVFTGYTGSFTGLRSGDNITPLYDSPGAPASALVGIYPITVTLDDPDNRLGNYNVTIDPAPAATLTVNPHPLTITANNRSKVYGEVVIFAGTEFTTGAGQLVNGNTVTSVTLTSAGAADNATVAGSPYAIIPSAAVGTGLGNYVISYINGALTINKPDLIVTSDSQTKTYGDLFPVASFTGSIAGLQAGDVITPSYSSTGSAANADVGSYPIPIALADPGGRLANYNLIQNIGTLTVTRRDLTVVAEDKTKLYGDTVTLTGIVNGVQAGDNITFTYSSAGVPPTAPVSTYSIAITLNDPNNRISNYNFTLTPGTLTVTQRDLVVTSDDKNKQYGIWFFAFTGSITGIQNGENITANYASAGSLPSAAVGPYPITITLNDPTGKLGNYNVILNEGTLTVGSSTLTVTADNKTITYGDPEPAFTFTYAGFAAGDDPSVIDTPPTCTVAVPHTDYGTYPIVCSGGADNAYTFTYVAGTLTVNQRALIVTPIDKTKVYGDIFTAFTGTITGIQGTDNITATYDSTGAPATTAIGNYPITALLNDPGNVLGNYAVTLNTGTLTVTPRALTVTPADKTKIYGDVFTAFTGTITGIQNGDAITATYASPGAVATATVAGSPYPITATLNADPAVLANYTIVTNTGELTVTLRSLTVTPDNKAKVFGTVFTAFTGTVTGVQAGDNITATYASTGAPAAALVGTYPITVTLNDPNGRLANYSVTLNTGTLTVGNTVLTVTADDQTIVYGNPDPVFIFTYSGFVGSDTPAVLDTLPTCQVLPAHNAIGTYPITCAGGIDDNYIFSYVPATLTVTPRALTVTPADQTKVYGSIFTAFTGATTGIQGADNITVTYASAGAAATANVGTYPITATLNDPNNRLGNYTVTLNTGTMTVTRRALVATSDDKTKAYGEVFTAFTGSIVGIQNGDNITATYASTGAPAAATAGNYPITIALNDPDNRLPNYTVTYNLGTLFVGGNALIVTPADKTKIYGETFTAFTGTIVGLQPGDNITATYTSTGAGANADIGDYNITVTLNDPDNRLPNYTVILNTGTLSVTPRALSVTPDNKAKVFGTTFTAFTGTVSGIAVGDNITATYSSPGAAAGAAVGAYPINAALVDPGGRLSNYTITLNTGTLTVGNTVLTITANNQTLVYGDPDPTFTFTYSGFQGGDTPAVLTTLPTCQVLPAHNAVGTYPITCSGGVDDNYVFSYVPATLTVTSRALIVTPDDKSKLYGDTFTAFTGTLTGLQASDNITASYASTGAAATATVGTYPITVAALNDPDNRLGNYTITQNTSVLAVTQRALSVTSHDKIKFYGSLFTAFTGTITGIQNNDNLTATYASTGGPVTAIVGDYPITITLNDPGNRLPNYAVTTDPGTLTVAPRDLVITPADKSKSFGNLFTNFTGTIIGLRNGDNITATYDSAGGPASAPVGTYDIDATLVDPNNRLPNYDVSLNSGTLTVNMNSQAITITIPAPTSAGFNTTFTVAALATSGLPVEYSAGGTACTNVGATFTMVSNTGVCIVQYDQLGDANYPPAPQLTQNVVAQKNNQVITVDTSAPPTALNGTSFTVSATASSGLPVNIISNGNCSGNGSGSAVITMANGTGICTIIYGQPGDAYYMAATSISEIVSVTNIPVITLNPQDAWVLPGATATFTAAAVGNPNPTVHWQVSADGGTTFTDIPGATSTTYSIPNAQLVDSGLQYQAVFTNTEGNATSTIAILHVDNVPPLVTNVNSVSDTGDGHLTEMEISTLAITKLLVTFNENLSNPAGNNLPGDVTNPANYLLVRDNGDGIQTTTCSAGITGSDIAVTVDLVSYDDNGGSGPYTSSLYLNGSTALPNGLYRLIVCGTTSITDVAGNKLAGDNTTAGTDFTRNFVVAVPEGGGSEGKGQKDKAANYSGFLIPVTGFAPNTVTITPEQPAEKAYSTYNGLTLEIPRLKVKVEIVGVPASEKTWDVSWLGNNAGFLEGSAFPTASGNSVLTAHVWDAYNQPGTFYGLKDLIYGDKILIHAWGKIFTYEVRTKARIYPESINIIMRHEKLSWITLVTCEEYSEKSGKYTYRRIVRAVLISVTPEK